MNCIIIDDEPLAIKVIEKYLERVPDINCRSTFSDPLKALDYLSEHSVDLLFLDINMPDLTGLGLLKLLKQEVLVVFTTAYAEYAVKSYEYQAVDYLLKPFGLDRFLQAISKARERRPEEQLKEEVLLLRADRKIYRIPYSDILFLEAYGDYVKVHTKEQIIVPKIRLNQLEEELPTQWFIRTHRTYLINRGAVAFIEGNQLSIGTHKIPISRQQKETVFTALGLD
ncbi:MAG TPA: LytTR family DNA-binding domain-containing protein [Saprospiraceae bacterium]|nr:LytTR family DNA-binding domain-containing protein [Saprospiraceae bacterium]